MGAQQRQWWRILPCQDHPGPDRVAWHASRLPPGARHADHRGYPRSASRPCCATCWGAQYPWPPRRCGSHEAGCIVVDSHVQNLGGASG
jgi:hypothetical protein